MAAGSQTTLLSELSLPELTDLVRREWVYTRENIVRNARQLYIEEMVGAGQGVSKRYNEVDVETYADFKAEGSNSKKAKVGVGYSVDMIARTFSKEVDITLEMRNDNHYAEVGTYIKNLSEFCDNRMDLDLTHRLTFAGSTSYTDMNGESVTTTVGNGLALAGSVHTLAFSSTTYSNELTGDPAFSESSLESALLIAATNIYSNFGEKREMRFNTIISGNDPNTMRTIKQVLQSTADIDAAQAGVVNVYNGKFNHVILPNLATTAAGAYNSAKRRYWFLAATGQGFNGWQAVLGIWNAPTLLTPSESNNGMDIHNYNFTYSTYCRYGIATISPKGLICSLVAS